MNDDARPKFLDLNLYRGVGEDPVYRPPHLIDRPRGWPLDRWAEAPRDLGFDDFPRYHWKGLRLLKDPATQSTYHDLLWEIRPRTIVELGVYSGGSLLWFHDVTRMMGVDCRVIGVDRNLARCQLSDAQMDGISLHEGDCNAVASLAFLGERVQHPLVFIDDAHCNTFNVMQWAVDELLAPGDYFIIEDMMPFWERYSPALLAEYLASFRNTLEMDMVFANACAQLARGVFRRSVVEQQGAQLEGSA